MNRTADLPDILTIIKNGKPAGLGGEFVRYFIVSLVALAADFGTLVGLTELFGIPYLVSNVAGFILGAVVVYIGGIVWVFANRRLSDARAEFIIFVMIGVGGLGVNEGVLWLFTSGIGFHYTFSKVFAAAASFAFNFLVRKYLLFR